MICDICGSAVRVSQDFLGEYTANCLGCGVHIVDDDCGTEDNPVYLYEVDNEVRRRAAEISAKRTDNLHRKARRVCMLLTHDLSTGVLINRKALHSAVVDLYVALEEGKP